MAPIRLWLALGLLSIAAVFLGQAVATLSTAASVVRLPVTESRIDPETSLPRSIRTGEVHLYRFRLDRGQVFAVVVEQRGADVVLDLLDPGGRRLVRVDSPTVTEGAERVFVISSVPGTYQLRINGLGMAALQGRQGNYALRWEMPRLATERDRRIAQASAEFSLGEELRREAAASRQAALAAYRLRQAALVAYRQSLQHWQALGDLDGQATTLARVGKVHEDLKDFPQAADAYRRALSLSRDARERAALLVSIGSMENHLGEPLAALGHSREALDLARRSGSLLSEARALALSGHLSAKLGELDTAVLFLEQALEKWSLAGSRAGRLRTLQDFAWLVLLLGEPVRALDLLSQAREIEPDQAATQRLLGMAFFQCGAGIALQILDRALANARAEGDLQTEVVVLAEIGSVALHLGKVDLAAASFEESLQIAVARKDPQKEAYARAGRGRVLGLRGRFDEARAELEQAEAMFRRLEERESLALVLAGKAQLERDRGNLHRALELAREAADLIESQRREIANPRARAALLSVWSDPYEIQIDVLWRLAARAPGRGFDGQAFEVSEKIRARTLYEGLAGRSASEQPETAGWQQRRREVTRQLGNLELRKLRLPADPGKAHSQRLQIDAEIRDLLASEDSLWQKSWRRDPRVALAGHRTLTLPQVQALLDRDTALIAYTLGADRSFVWWIERSSLTMLEIPAQNEIEALALRVQSLLADLGAQREPQSLKELLARMAELVLAPVADKLPRVRRLAVVPDGALQALPFALLPGPGAAGPTSGEPLVASHVLVHLPSPSTLAALRRRAADREQPDKLIAVIADPVFEPDDPRLGARAAHRGIAPRSGWTRLTQTKEEAEKILDLVPEGQGLKLIGFEAVREAVKDPDLRRYRYLHFGTHGLVDARHPELSGIVLTGFTPDGRPRDGRLRFYDVYDLDLPVDLVSLSTCRSADGPQVRREGPITMTRSFFYAGASRVLGTLWNVSDKPAAELTTAFYVGVFAGKTPAEALRDAQNAMRSDKWPAHDWAAFVLQGDW